MFDIGFGELLVCAIVALLVLGPERLPGAVRTVGRWVGRARHTVNHFTEQIDREIRAEELKRRIEEEIQKSGLDDVNRQVKEALHAPISLKHPDLAPAQAETLPDNRIAPPALEQAQAGTAVDDLRPPAEHSPAASPPSPANSGNDKTP